MDKQRLILFADSSAFAPWPQILLFVFLSPNLCLLGAGKLTSEDFVIQVPLPSCFWLGFSRWREMRRWEEREVGVFTLLDLSLPHHGSSSGLFLYRHSQAVGVERVELPPWL